MTAKLLLPTNKKLLADAWHLVKGTKWHFFLWFLLSMIFGCVIILILHTMHLDTWSQAHMNDWGILLIPMMASMASSLFFLGATSMGIARARAHSLTLRIAFTPWRKLCKVIVVLFCVMLINLFVSNLVNSICLAGAIALKQSAIVYVGIIIADLLMLVINTLFLVAIPTTVGTPYGPIQSMYLSASYMRPHLWQGFWLLLILYILAFLSIFTLFISYLWLLPLSFILFGQLYLRLIPQQKKV